MKRARYTSGLVILILLASLVTIPKGMAIIPQEQTISIIDTHDDKFITEAGIGIDAWLCHILDPAMDIRSYLVFRELEINWWEPLENATLRLRTTVNLDFGADSSVTIYGMKYSNLQDEGVISTSFVLSVPVTSAHVNVNTSQFYGQQWHEIDVTSIVEELIRVHDWDGDGLGYDTGDDIGFVIYGDEGYDTRWFIDYHYGTPSLASQLVIHWNHEVPPPSESAPPPYNDTDVWEWEYVNTTRGIDIFTATSYGDPSVQFIGGAFTSGRLWYHNTTKGIGGEYSISTNMYDFPTGGGIDPILSLDPWTLCLMDNGSLKIMVSDDEFLTYNLVNPNAQYSSLSSYGGNWGSLALDELDETTIHLVYTTVTPAHTGNYNVVYMNFTINPDTGDLTFAPSYTNITQVGSTQVSPTLYCQENGTLHVVYYGKQGTSENQIYYRRRHWNGTWLAQVRVSDTDVGGYPHQFPDVVANEDTGVALVIWEYDREKNYWDVVFPNNTDSVDRLMSTGVTPAMVNDRENNIAQAVWSSEVGQPGTVYHQTKAIDNSSSWSGNMQVSPGGQKHFRPDIGIDHANRTLQAIWYNDWNLWVAGNFWDIGATPVAGVTRLTNQRIDYLWIENEFSRIIAGVVYFASYPNGTLIDGPYDTLDDVILAIEEELGHDPEDPDPIGEEWEQTGPFTRFRVRLYFLIIGFGCLFGPILFFAWRRPSGYYVLCGAILMLMGLGMLLSVGQV